MKQTPSLENLLSLLKHYTDVLCPYPLQHSLNGGIRSGDRQGDIMDMMKTLLRLISANVWKCFHISDALHPYSQDALDRMYRTFSECALLPTLSLKGSGRYRRRFVSLKGSIMSEPFQLGNDTDSGSDSGSDSDNDIDDDDEDKNENGKKKKKKNEEEEEEEDDEGDNDNDYDDKGSKVKKEKETNGKEIEEREGEGEGEGEKKKEICSIKTLIAVDDIDLFNMFQLNLSEVELSEIIWIDACSTMKDRQMSEFDSDDIVYNTQALKADSDKLLSADHRDFMRMVSIAPVQTFYAPKTSVALFKFLDVPSLSKLVTKCKVSEEHSLPSDELRKMTTKSCSALTKRSLNTLLEIAQCVLHMKRGEMYCERLTPYLQSVFSLTIKECPHLEADFSLDLGSIDSRFQGVRSCRQDIPFHIDIGRDTDDAIQLLISQSITEEEVLTMCIDIVSNKLELQLALMDKTQPFEIMKDIRGHMETYSIEPWEDFRFKTFKIDKLPPHVPLWSLVALVEDDEDDEDDGGKEAVTVTEMEEKSTSEVILSPEAIARGEAYWKLNEQSKENAKRFIEQSTTAPKVLSEEKMALMVANDNQLERVKNIMNYRAQQDVENIPIVVTLQDLPVAVREDRLSVAVFEGQRYSHSDDEKNDLKEGDGGGEMGRDNRIDPHSLMVGEKDSEVNKERTNEMDSDVVRERGQDPYTMKSRTRGHLSADSTDGGGPLLDSSNGTREGTFPLQIGPHSGPFQGDLGHRIGGGTYDPEAFQFSSFPVSSSYSANSVDLWNLLSKDSLDSNHLLEIAGLTGAESAAATWSIADVLMTRNSKAVGRVGEYLASEYLLAMSDLSGFQSVEWLNKKSESGLPYDIKIEMKDGSNSKFCEVKARSVRAEGDQHSINQWFISQNEVMEAASRGSDYFAICLTVSVDIQGKISPRSFREIGLTGGLSGCLVEKAASLILQLNDSSRVE